MTKLHPQLSFEIAPHPNTVRDDEPDGYLTGSLKLGGDFVVREDLQSGAELTVSIADEDGSVIAQAVVEVGAVGFVPIKDDGRTIGMERVHKAKVMR